MKKLPNFVKWIIILAALAAMGWMMWAVNHLDSPGGNARTG